MRRVISIFLAVVLAASSLVFAFQNARASGPPQTFGYQGTLTSSGTAVSGTKSITVRIFDRSSGGNLLYTESHPSVAVDSGFFSLTIGDTTPLTGITFNQALFLELIVEGTTMSPRQIINTVPYANVAYGALATSTAPTATTGGLLYYDTTNGKLFVFDDLSLTWVDLTSATADTFSSFNGVGIRSVTNAQNLLLGASATTTNSKLEVAGNTSLLGNLVVSGAGTSTFVNGIDLSAGCFAVGGGCVVGASGSASFTQLTLLGSTTLQDFTALNSTTTNATTTNFSVTGTASTTNLTTGTLAVVGSATSTFANGIDLAAGCFAVNGSCVVGVGGIASFTELLLTGSTTLQDFSAQNATTTSLAVVGSASSTSLTTGTLAVVGSATSTFANGIDLSAGCFAVNGVCVVSATGAGSFTTLDSAGLATLGNLLVTGSSTLQDLTATAARFLDVFQASSTALFGQGFTTFASSTLQDFSSVNGTTTNLAVVNNADIGNDLLVNNDATVSNNLTVNGLTFLGDLSSTGLGTLANLLVTGSSTLQNFSGVNGTTTNFAVLNNLNVQNNLRVTNDASVQNDLSVQNDVNVQNDLNVQNIANFGFDVNVDNTLSVGNDINGQNNLTISNDINGGNDLNLSNDANIGNNLSVNGLTFLTDLTLTGSTTLQDFTAVNATTSNATTTGSFAVSGVATTTDLRAGRLAVTGSATSTAVNGFDLASGCFSVNGTCLLSNLFGDAIDLASGEVAGVLPIASGGTNATSFGRSLLWFDGTSIAATSSQVTVGNIIATSTAQSTFNGPLGASSTALFSQGFTAFASSTLQNFTGAHSTTTMFAVIGSGTSTIATDLWVKGTLRTGNASLYLNDNGISESGGAFFLGSHATSTFATTEGGLTIGGNKLVVEQTSGHVGINTATPGSAFVLDVNGDARIAGTLSPSTLHMSFNCSAAGNALATNGSGDVVCVTVSAGGTFFITDNNWNYDTANDYYFTATSTSRVSIGANSPVQDTVLTVTSNNGASTTLALVPASSPSQTADILAVQPGPGNFATSTLLTNTQRLGLGLGAGFSRPTAKLSVRAVDSAGSAETNAFNVISAANSEIFTIKEAGNVGIGDSAPGALFTVGSGGLFRINSSGAITALTGLTTTGGYTQSGADANTFTGATGFSGLVTLSSVGTALTVNNNASIGGALSAGSFLSNGSSTLQNFTGVNATTSNATTTGTLAVTGWTTFGDAASDINLFIGTLQASSTALFTQGLTAFASTTLQNFTGVNATTTSATTTLLAITGSASSTDLRTGKLSVTGSATSTFGNGIDITAGCFSVNGVCIGSGNGLFATLNVTGLSTFANLLLTGSTTLQNFTGVNATTSNATTTGALTVGGLGTFANLLVNGSTTLQAFTATAARFINTLQASSTTLVGGNLLTFANSTFGDASTDVNLFSGTLQASSTALFTQGLTAFASTTLQNFTFANATGTNATTTGVFAVSGTATTTDLRTGRLTVTGSATSTFANGINLTAGCFAVNNTCLGDSGFIDLGASVVLSTITDSFGIGTSTPFAKLSINGDPGGTKAVFAVATSTSGFATTSAFVIDQFGRVGIGSSSPNRSAALLIDKSTKGGLGLPNYSIAERDSIQNPIAGLMIYNTSNGVPEFFDGSSWQPAVATSGPSFRAVKLGGTQSGTNGTVTFSNEEYDTNNNFDLATETFTPSIPGFYSCTASIFTTGGVLDGNRLQLQLSGPDTDILSADVAGATTNQVVNVSSIMRFDGINDGVSVTFTSSNSVTIDNGAVFACSMVGGPGQGTGGGWADDGNVVRLVTNNDQVAIGTTTPSNTATKLTVWGSGITNTTNALEVLSNASTTLFRVSNGGAVSIGVTTSTTTINGFLDVLGINSTSTFSGNLAVNGNLKVGTGSIFLNGGATSTFSGALGIGTTSPFAQFSIKGSSTSRTIPLFAISTTTSAGVERTALMVDSTGKLLLGSGVGSSGFVNVNLNNTNTTLFSGGNPVNSPQLVLENNAAAAVGNQTTLHFTSGSGLTPGSLIMNRLTSTSGSGSDKLLFFVNGGAGFSNAESAAVLDLGPNLATFNVGSSGVTINGSTGNNGLIINNAGILAGEKIRSNSSVGGPHIGVTSLTAYGTAACVSNSGQSIADLNSFGSCTSDERLKENISFIASSTLDIIRALQPSRFNFIGTSTPRAGFIAQQVQPYIPEAITGTDQFGFLTWDSNAVLSYAVRALQEVATTTAFLLNNWATTTAPLIIAGADGSLSFGTTSALFIGSDGNIAIGTSTDPLYKLKVGGDAAATGFVNVSTASAKTDIEHLTSQDEASILDKIEGLQVATYHYKTEDPENPNRLGLIAEEAPTDVLSADGKGVDIYKLATFGIAGIKAQQRELAALQSQIASLGGGVAGLSVSELIDLLKVGGITIVNGSLTAKSITAEKLCIGTTCVTEDELKELLQKNSISPVVSTPPSPDSPESSSTPPVTLIDTEAPVLHMNGNNPATISVGSSYIDPGATVTDNVTNNLNVNVTGVGIDTSVPGTFEIHYNAVDGAGNAAQELTRVVNVVAE